MSVVEELVRLSLRLGDPSADLAILAEGNASAKAGDTFWVKASGFSLSTMNSSGLVQVDLKRALGYLDGKDLDDTGVREALKASRIDEGCELMPSVETFMHAFLLSLPEIEFVGHTHPTALLSLLVTDRAEDYCSCRIFPDEVVCCGPATAYVPYVDPGLPLARAIRESVEGFIEKWGSVPKTIWLQNHGLIVLGKNSKEIESGTMMAVKAARVWIGALSSGQDIQPLTEEQVNRIHTRPDEHYRQRLLWQLKGNQS